jgi:hypothetical protein
MAGLCKRGIQEEVWERSRSWWIRSYGRYGLYLYLIETVLYTDYSRASI